MSESTVKRRRASLQLQGSRSMNTAVEPSHAEQLVINQLDNDLAKGKGVESIWYQVAYDDGVHLTKQFVRDIMHAHDPEGFQLREPTSKCIHRVAQAPIGVHHQWAADGHDKLNKIGFPIWGIFEHATSVWLKVSVVPNNRLGKVVAYLFLCAVEEHEGICVQFNTDLGSETTVIFGIVNALREKYHPELDNDIIPAHRYLPSTRNVAAEQNWLQLRVKFGDTAVLAYRKGEDDGIYNPTNPKHFELCQWLWSKLIQRELDALADITNGRYMRANKHKAGPQGMTRLEAYHNPESWGGRNYLLPIKDMDTIRQMKEELGGEALIAFSTPEFSRRAQLAFDSLGMVGKITFMNVWTVFTAMLDVLPTIT
ncbi:hypothetical protein C0993_007386 [Termitomyces sp. T159_Od127]|nr:hypothetical protein C0993_007386 [Termitomyces sp. T159_Od127]